MNLNHRDWPVVARSRELPALNSGRELRQALLLQMTPAELKSYRRRHFGLILAMLALALALAWVVPWSPRLFVGWFLVFLFYRLRYWHIDPVTTATVEYNKCLEAVVRRTSEAVRQQRIDAGR